MIGGPNLVIICANMPVRIIVRTRKGTARARENIVSAIPKKYDV